MIGRVTIRDWKRHRDASHVFEPGLNFVLGPNGSGKTSLLTGMKFALLGIVDGAPSTYLHSGSSLATAEIELDSVIGATVVHTLDIRGKTEASLRTTSELKGVSSVADMLVDRFRADAAVLSQLLFLSEGDIYAYEHDGGSQIEAQLEELLPLGVLRRLEREASKARKPLAKPIREQRSELQLSRDEAVSLQQELGRLESQLSEMTAKLEKAREYLKAIRARVEHRKMLRDKQHLYEVWFQGWQQFLRDSGQGGDVDESRPPLDVLESMQGRRREIQERLLNARENRGQISAQIESRWLFIETLETTTEEQCPLCRQPLDASHRAAALAEQQEAVDVLQSEATATNSRVAAFEGELSTWDHHISQCQSLIADWPGLPDVSVVEDDDLDGELIKAEEAFDALQGKIGLTNQQMGETRQKLAMAEANRSLELKVTSAFRQTAQLDVIESTIKDFMREVRVSTLSPVADELRRQWKSYRPDSDWVLDLDEDGRLCITHGERRLPYSALSGGEKTVSLILLRIALVRALTTADFVVLDEPLEHLDARSRRLLVSSLNQAVSRGIVGQVILSTYEESLARRLVLRSKAHAIFVTQ